MYIGEGGVGGGGGVGVGDGVSGGVCKGEGALVVVVASLVRAN